MYWSKPLVCLYLLHALVEPCVPCVTPFSAFDEPRTEGTEGLESNCQWAPGLYRQSPRRGRARHGQMTEQSKKDMKI